MSPIPEHPVRAEPLNLRAAERPVGTGDRAALPYFAGNGAVIVVKYWITAPTATGAVTSS